MSQVIPKSNGIKFYSENLIPLSKENFLKILCYRIKFKNDYSHSIVAGGFELISYTTLFTPLTLLMMSFEIFIKNS